MIFFFLKILAQCKIEVPKNVLMPHLHDTLSNCGADLLLQCIEDLPKYIQNAQQQSQTGITYGNYSHSIDSTQELFHFFFDHDSYST